MWPSSVLVFLSLMVLAGCGTSPVTHAAGPSAGPATLSPAVTTATSTSLPARTGQSLVADAAGPQVSVYPAPGASQPTVVLPNPWLLNGVPGDRIPQVFLVLGTSAGGWIHVMLSQRPNGSSGWLAPRSATIHADPYSIQVVLHEHQIKVVDAGAVIYTGAVATGAPATPTPVGLYYIRVLLRSVDPASVYGPFAYGLSAHSDALTTFDGGDAEIGIHGNDDAAVLGQSVTHGCVRMDNVEITKLSKLLPLGTPVKIDP